MFITLSYNEKHLPEDMSIDITHFQKFLKRYRKYLKAEDEENPKPIRYFHCGEYGEENLRPHYHAAIFGHKFDDQVESSVTEKGDQMYTSATLDKIWGLGKCWIGQLNFQSAGYIARYIMKKIGGAAAAIHYQHIDPLTGEVHQVLPEYVSMSLKPGIGKKWFEKFHADVYPSDEVMHQGKSIQPPKYYDTLYAKQDPEGWAIVQSRRIKRGLEFESDNTPDRREAKETVKNAAIENITRNKNAH